jgi:flavin reductase (DIM6/NTAB) family NADH-FMN oxidoreductase RutF
MPKPEFRTVEPKILYFGTPVALVSSLNEDSSTNLAPISSFWALGWTLMWGLLDEAKTAENLRRKPECVVNLPSPDMWRQVEKLAMRTIFGRPDSRRWRAKSYSRSAPKNGRSRWRPKSTNYIE